MKNKKNFGTTKCIVCGKRVVKRAPNQVTHQILCARIYQDAHHVKIKPKEYPEYYAIKETAEKIDKLQAEKEKTEVTSLFLMMINPVTGEKFVRNRHEHKWTVKELYDV